MSTFKDDMSNETRKRKNEETLKSYEKGRSSFAKGVYACFLRNMLGRRPRTDKSATSSYAALVQEPEPEPVPAAVQLPLMYMPPPVEETVRLPGPAVGPKNGIWRHTASETKCQYCLG